MRRPVRPEEWRLWSKVAATVRPAAGRTLPDPPEAEPNSTPAPADAKTAPEPPARVKGPSPKPCPPPKPASSGPNPIEPGRKRRIVREQELGPALDLHGLDQDRARQALTLFLHQASAEGWRAVLVITGKGTRGGGVLRQRTPEWLADPSLRGLVAGVSEAHRTHGGAGALYVALKRRKEG